MWNLEPAVAHAHTLAKVTFACGPSASNPLLFDMAKAHHLFGGTARTGWVVAETTSTP